MWASLRALAYKEFLNVMRMPGVVRTVITLQMVQMVLLGFIDVNTRNLPTVVVDQDYSAESRALLQKMSATKTFEIKYMTNSVSQARALIQSGRARVGVVIPPDFHEQRARGKNASILTLVDGSDATSTGQALAAMNGLVAQMNVDAQQEDVASSERGMAFAARALILFNPLGRTANFMLPGMMVIVMQVFIQMSANSLVIEQEMGTMERLLMTPVDFTGMMLGKMAPYWVISMIDIVLLLLAMRWGFGIPIRGSVPLLLGAYGLFMINMLAWGLLFAATAVHPTQVGQRAMLFSIPALFLTGYIFPLSGLPWWLLPISYAHPITHQMEIVRGIILRGSSFSDLLPHFFYLIVAPFVLIGLSVRRFRESLYS